jgi:hypothetical protein
MTNSTIISLAILKVNWDELRKGYLDNFVPIVAECIRRSSDDVVSLPDVQNDLENLFGLKIPQNVIRAILSKVRKQGYIRAEDRVYKRDLVKLDQLGFHDMQQKVVRMHECLIQSLIEFCSRNYGVTWSEEDAEEALQTYLQNNQVFITCAATHGTIIPLMKRSTKGSAFLVGSFVKHLQETHSADFDYFETVVKGNMLANAIFLPDPNQASRKFHRTEVYLDTSFLMFALGHAGQARRDPCSELLQLLYETGADLRCFRHTVEEIKGILDACASRLARGQSREAYGPSIGYFLAKGFTASDIELLSIRLEEDLEKLRIRVVDKPSYTPTEYVIDEQALSETLANNMSYGNPQALSRDVDSISAIMRLRNGRQFFAIEQCRALFVTMNRDLARESRKFYYREADFHTVCPCLTDGILTNLLWLKNPTKAPDLPRKRIIADCYAAMQPNTRLWIRYLEEIDKLEQDERVNEDEYYLLRYSLEAKSALMELTYGEEEEFTQGTVEEILELVRSRVKGELQSELESEKKRRGEVEEELIQALEAQTELRESARTLESDRISRVEARAQRYASAIAKTFIWLAFILLLMGAFFSFPWSFPSLRDSPVRYGISVLLTLLSLGNFVFGVTLKTLSHKLEGVLSRQIRKKLLDLSELQ